MNPKISDLGLARIFGGDQTEAETKKVVGTHGYMAPEYAMGGIFSIKSDVFSFGVLVLEIVTGQRNKGSYYASNQLNLLGQVISKLERRVVAYHASGHAIAGWFLEHAEPLLKVTIVPRGTAALGFARYVTNENLLMTKEQHFNLTCMTLGVQQLNRSTQLWHRTKHSNLMQPWGPSLCNIKKFKVKKLGGFCHTLNQALSQSRVYKHL